MSQRIQFFGGGVGKLENHLWGSEGVGEWANSEFRISFHHSITHYPSAFAKIRSRSASGTGFR